mgnify:CR=1 FL=1
MSRKKTFAILQEQILDVEEQIMNDTIKLIPLGLNKKFPSKKDYYNTEYDLPTLKNNNGNLGVCVGYNHEENGRSLAVIDVDGYTLDCEDEAEKSEVKRETADAIYEILKKIPGAIHVRTQSGGHHLYFWNKTFIENIHEISKNLHFPEDYKIQKLQGKSLDQSIEIFTKWQSKQCVLPGSRIKKNHYTVVDDTCNFGDMATVSNIHETVKKAMVDAGYKYYQEKTESKITSSSSTIMPVRKLKELNKKEVKQLASLLSPYFKTFDGIKHYSYLYLGGYLCQFITAKSAKHVTKEILKQTKDNYQKHVTTVLKNYQRNNNNKKGLRSLIDNIKQKNPEFNSLSEDKLRFRLNRLVNLSFKYDIIIGKPKPTSETHLRLDYQKCTIGTRLVEYHKDKDPVIKNDRIIANFIPEKIFLSYDLLHPQNKAKLCLTYYSNGMPYKQTIEADSIKSIENELSDRAGIILEPRDFSGILNKVIKEYEKLNLIEIVTDIPVPGVFTNPKTGELCRANKNGSVPITCPRKEKVLEALDIWRKLHEIYPGDPTKLSHIIRWGLASPFSFIKKTEYEWFPMLFLYGASRTSKTTLAEICLSPYTEITDEVSIGGGAFDTVYRIGEALSRQGYGLIINEPGNAIETKKTNLDVIKRGVENAICREKQENGVHVRIPAYSNMLFTANSFIPSNDAFIRRTDYIEFTKNERMTEEDQKVFNETFHFVSQKNNDFRFLHPIGDFIIFYVHENMELLKLSRDDFVNTLLDALFKWCGVEPMEWLYRTAELMTLGNSDDEVLTIFRLMILEDYNRSVGNNPKLLEALDTLEEFHAPTINNEYKLDEIDLSNDESEAAFKSLFTGVVSLDKIPYLHFAKLHNGCEYIYVTSAVKQAITSYSNRNGLNFNITCKGLADYMKEEYKNYKYKGKAVKCFRIEYNVFREFLNS